MLSMSAQFVKSGTANANYTSVLTLLLRLRQGGFTFRFICYGSLM